jgi:tetratricopeptide (TPR) repeat protein
MERQKNSLIRTGVAAVFVSAFAFVIAAGAKEKDKPKDSPQIDKSMSVTEARQQIASAMNNIYDWDGGITYGEVRITNQEFNYVVSVNGNRSAFSAMAAGKALIGGRPGQRIYSFKDTPFLDSPEHHLGVGWCVRSSLDLYKKDNFCWKAKEDIKAKTNAEQFVKAMNRMIWENSPDGKALREAADQAFQQKLAAWRTGGYKVKLPPEAYPQKVLGENAFQEKDYIKAISEYKAALAIYPTWPDGQSNLAWLCGETSDFACAVQHMQNYLELVPDAPDAHAAKDKLIIWRDKLVHSQ